MTTKEIFNHSVNLITEMEGFRPHPYWDVSRWSWGYGTEAPAQFGSITQSSAKEALENHLKDDFKKFDIAFPNLINDPIKIALLSKAYQYGDGIFNSLKAFKDDKKRLIAEAFFIDEKYPTRRKKEFDYYQNLIKNESYYFELIIGLCLFLLSIWFASNPSKILKN